LHSRQLKSAGAGFRAAGEDIFEILSKFRQRYALLLAMGIVKPDTRHFSSAEAKAIDLLEGCSSSTWRVAK